MDPGADIRSGLGFSARVHDGCTVVTLSGELDLASAPVLRERLLRVLGPHVKLLVVDLSQVSFCDASGLAVLVGTGRRARLLGAVLRIAGPSPPVTAILRSTGLNRRLDIYPTVLAASTGADELSSYRAAANWNRSP